jgi:LmbE family N-acetylglucosaminyl deacetylase
VSELLSLGYADSGLDGRGTSSIKGVGRSSVAPFTGVDVDTAAARLAEVVMAERADLLVGYDAAGGYGHPDHVRVHRVARRAADLSGGIPLLEATLPREPLARAVAAAHRMRRLVPALGGLDPAAWARANSRSDAITHRVDVRGFTDAKRAAMAAHASQAGADGDVRTLQVLLRLPRPVFRRLLGREWFVGTRPTRFRYYTHPLAALRGR